MSTLLEIEALTVSNVVHFPAAGKGLLGTLTSNIDHK